MSVEDTEPPMSRKFWIVVSYTQECFWEPCGAHFALVIGGSSIALRVLNSVGVGVLPLCQTGYVRHSGSVIVARGYDYSVEVLLWI